MKTAIVTGIRGMDGSIMAGQLLSEGWRVFGVIRRSSSGSDLGQAKDLTGCPNLTIVEGDLLDLPSIQKIQDFAKPDWFLNLAAMSHVGTSFSQPVYTLQCNTIGTLNCLEAIRHSGIHTRFLHAASISGNTPVLIRVDEVVYRTTMQDAYEKWKVQDFNIYEVWSLEKETLKTKFLPVSDVICHGEKTLYKVTTEGIGEIEVTPDHSLFYLSNDQLKHQETTKFNLGDSLITFCDVTENLNQTCFSWKYVLKKPFTGESVNYTKTLDLDYDIAYLLGMYAAEGCTSYNKSIFTFGKHPFDSNRPEDVRRIINDKFGVSVYINERDSSIQVQTAIREITSCLSLCGTRASNKRVPNFLWQSPKDIVLAFLWGACGDANFRPNGSIQITTINKDYAIDLHYLLRRIGVSNIIKTRINKEHLSPQKTIIKTSQCFDIEIPAYGNPFEDCKINGQKIPNCLCLPKNGLTLNLEKNISRDKLLEYNNFLGNSSIGISRIKSIQKVDSALVYDFCVPDSEMFFAGTTPILAHNTSEMFGGMTSEPCNENSVFHPRSPYGISKLAAYWLTVNYREAYKMFAVNSICYNHECEKRGPEFVTQKIATAAARISLGLQKKVFLGNLDARRDWGFAPDFVRGMRMMLSAAEPEDYCISSDTEILTNNGWRTIDTIQETDMAFSINTLTRETVADPIIKIIKRKYSGDMYKFTGKDLDLFVTKNHRILYQYKDRRECRSQFNFQSPIKEKFSHEFPTKHWNKVGDYMIPSAGNLADTLPNDPSMDEATLVGWLVTEGCLINTGKPNYTFRLSLSQSEKKYYTEIKTLLDSMNFQYRDRKRKDLVHEFIFNAADSRDMLKLLGFSKEIGVHRIPRKFLNAGRRILEAVFNSMIQGDGHIVNSHYFVYVTKSTGLCDDFQELCIRLGFRCTKTQQANGMWNLQVNKNRFPVKYIQKIDIEENFSGFVWCIETQKNKNFLCRKNNAYCFVGNCMATGETHSVREFCDACFSHLGMDYQEYVEIDPLFFRPAEVDVLLGDYSKINRVLGWKPTVTFAEIATRMTDAALEKLKCPT